MLLFLYLIPQIDPNQFFLRSPAEKVFNLWIIIATAGVLFMERTGEPYAVNIFFSGTRNCSPAEALYFINEIAFTKGSQDLAGD